MSEWRGLPPLQSTMLTSFHRGNLGTSNSILRSQFSSGLPVALGASEFTGTTPFPSLSSSGDCGSRLGCRADSGKYTRPGVARETKFPGHTQGLCLVPANLGRIIHSNDNRVLLKVGAQDSSTAVPQGGLAVLPLWPRTWGRCTVCVLFKITAP